MNIVFKVQSKLDETFTRMLALRFREDIDKKLLSPKFSPDLLCIQQSYAAFFCETYTKLYFQLNQIEKELTLNRKRWNYWCLFFQERTCDFWSICDAVLIFYMRLWSLLAGFGHLVMG